MLRLLVKSFQATSSQMLFSRPHGHGLPRPGMHCAATARTAQIKKASTVAGLTDIKEGTTIETDPARLTCKIKEATTITALLSLHRAHKVHWNRIHLSACWTSLGELVK